jgi:hypothetical protein
MMLGGAPLASTAPASMTPHSTAGLDPEALAPLALLYRQVQSRHLIAPGSLSIRETQGEQASAEFTMVNAVVEPVVGATVEIRYFSQVLFAGTVDRVDLTIDSAGRRVLHRCTAVDWSQRLVRRKVRRNWSQVPISTLLASLLDNELAGEGFTAGDIDVLAALTLVEGKDAPVLDVLRDVAKVTGTVLIIDVDRRIHFRQASIPVAPLSLTGDVFEMASRRVDRDAYRNVQTVIASGTPPDGSDEDSVVVIVTAENAEQIAERIAIEGGSGRYEHTQKVTHPISNTWLDVAALAHTMLQLLLSIHGVLRQTIGIRVRSYGWRAGQLATVESQAHGITGTWQIQKVTLRDEARVRLVHDVELVPSSLQHREFSTWSALLQSGAVTVVYGQLPGTNVVEFSTPGNHEWVVPAGITTITITTLGASGGGAASDYNRFGGRGGSSGRTVSTVAVTPGDIIDIVIGTRGTGGPGTPRLIPTNPGTAGTYSQVLRGGVELSRAEGGGGGKGCTQQANGAIGTPGGGSNGAVLVGGGQTGGAPGPVNISAGSVGLHGHVSIQY